MAKREKCDNCLRPINHCYCHKLISFNTESKILILRHEMEAKHPFNTALMAKLQIPSLILLTDHDETDSGNIQLENIVQQELIVFIKKYKPFLLFMNQHSKDLEKNLSSLPSKNFIILDGTWDKAKSLLYKYHCLQELPVFHLDCTVTSRYQSLRKACSESALSTLEACGYATGLINNQKIEGLFDVLDHVVSLQNEFKTKN